MFARVCVCVEIKKIEAGSVMIGMDEERKRRGEKMCRRNAGERGVEMGVVMR